MRTILLVSQKGGSGKSTLGACIAVAAREAGEKVFVLDMDPQRSLVKWGQVRNDKDIPVEAVSPAKLPAALASLAKTSISLVIIDSAGADTAGMEAGMKCADLCIIPARPTVFDIWSSELTRSRVKALGGDFVFVLNQCPALQESQRVVDGAKALENMGALVTPLIASRVDYQEAAREGMGVTELNPDGKAAGEIRHLWASLRRRLSRSKGASGRTSVRNVA